ncbi:MAG: AI-2E family transporter, partial [Clostridiales bacterium]|nr:AI-2E family transporter [Clostridiales bacterium]
GQSKKLIYAGCKPRSGNLVLEVLRETDRMFGGFFRGKLVDSLIIGVVCYIGCLILRMPNTFLIAVVIGVTNIIPFFGPFIGAIPCVFLVLVQNPIKALYLGIFILGLQQLDGNIIGPRILGNSTGLSSFWVMVAILVGGGMFGFPGMVLGVPVMGVIQYVVRRVVNFLLNKSNMPTETDEYFMAQSVDERTKEIKQQD